MEVVGEEERSVEAPTFRESPPSNSDKSPPPTPEDEYYKGFKTSEPIPIGYLDFVNISA